MAGGGGSNFFKKRGKWRNFVKISFLKKFDTENHQLIHKISK